MRSLTLQFIPYSEIGELSSDARIKKILKIVKQDRIALMEGRLSTEEEAGLIEQTMGEIGGRFRGVEVATIHPERKNSELINKLRENVFELLFGKKGGMTIVGPASIIKEIKRDPNKIQLFMNLPGK